MSVRRLLSALFTLSFCFSLAQNCVVKGVTSFAFTEKESYNNAVIEAQRKLIVDCGGGVRVSSNSLYSIQEDETGKVSDTFNESISLALSGLIKGFKITDVTTELLEGGQIKTTLDAQGKVIEPVQSDLQLNISGLKEKYFENDYLEMQLVSNMPQSYVYVFQSRDGQIELLCPNQVQSGVFDENGIVRIPNDRYKLKVTVDDADLTKESNTFFVIGSTRGIPYSGDGSVMGLINWYDNLPSKGRCFATQSVLYLRR